MKKLILVLGAVVIAVMAYVLITVPPAKPDDDANKVTAPFAEKPDTVAFDAKNSTFMVDTTKVTLQDGYFEKSTAPGSASKDIYRYFGNDAYGDLNFDGVDDMVFLISENAGGSGTFYYAVAAIATSTTYITTNAFFIGDRIAPQPIYISKGSGEIQVNYAERLPGEPMTAEPSQGAVTLLKVTPEYVLEGLMR